MAAIGPDQKGSLYPVNGGEPRPIPGQEESEEPISGGAEDRSLFIYRPGELLAKVYRLDMTTGQRTLWKQLIPSDLAGVNPIGLIVLISDGKTYVYGYHRTLTDLYLVKGLKSPPARRHNLFCWILDNPGVQRVNSPLSERGPLIREPLLHTF